MTEPPGTTDNISSVLHKMTGVKRRLLSIPQRLGVPGFKPVSISLGGVVTDLGMLPVAEVSPDLEKAWLGSSVEVSRDDLVVSDISREYPEDLVIRGVFLIGNRRYTVFWVDKKDVLCYKAVVRKAGAR